MPGPPPSPNQVQPKDVRGRSLVLEIVKIGHKENKFLNPFLQCSAFRMVKRSNLPPLTPFVDRQKNACYAAASTLSPLR